jgi:hypothetical protein
MVLKQASNRVYRMSVDFKGAHYPKSVILYAVYFYVRYGVSYRDLEEIMEYDKLLPMVSGNTGSIDIQVTGIAFADGTIESFE